MLPLCHQGPLISWGRESFVSLGPRRMHTHFCSRCCPGAHRSAGHVAGRPGGLRGARPPAPAPRRESSLSRQQLSRQGHRQLCTSCSLTPAISSLCVKCSLSPARGLFSFIRSATPVTSSVPERAGHAGRCQDGECYSDLGPALRSLWLWRRQAPYRQRGGRQRMGLGRLRGSERIAAIPQV